MSMLQAAMRALDLGNATSFVRMGLKSNQVFDVFSAYFKGVEFPRGGQLNIPGLKGLPGRGFVGAARAGLVGFGAAAAWNMLPRNTPLAATAGVATTAGTMYALGRQFPALSMGLRAAGGLLSGSLVYQGLRAPHQSEYQL